MGKETHILLYTGAAPLGKGFFERSAKRAIAFRRNCSLKKNFLHDFTRRWDLGTRRKKRKGSA